MSLGVKQSEGDNFHYCKRSAYQDLEGDGHTNNRQCICQIGISGSGAFKL